MTLSTYVPNEDVRGGIVLLQEAFGITEHIADVAKRLTDSNWIVAVPHLFHRTGDPVIPYDDIPAVMPHISDLSADQILEDVDLALSYLTDRGIDPKRTGVVGMCMGGTISLVTAVHRDVGAAVSLYGGGVNEARFGFGSLASEAPNLQAPWLGLYGDLDTTISVDDIEDLRAAAASSQHPAELVRYSEAGHGFLCDMRSDYHEASAIDAWARVLDWFDHHLRADHEPR